MTIAQEIFRAYDIRGIYQQNLYDHDAILIGKAIGSEIIAAGGDKVAVGCDGRITSPTLKENLISGLLSTGIDVIDIGAVPTPLLYFACFYYQYANGVMITGSHNPKDHNGFKIVINYEARANEQILKIYDRIINNKFILGEGSLTVLNIIDDYINYIKQDLKIATKLKIVVDCGNGIAGSIAKKLFANFCEVTELYCEVDGNFPNHHPDPSNPKNVQDLIKLVAKKKADLGLAFDGDGDRLGVITNSGEIINPDRLLMLFAEDILQRNPQAKIIYDIKCTSKLDKFIKNHHGIPIMWKTGHSLIKAKMKAENALLAGEMSGHIFFKERWYGFDDALYAACRLLEILSHMVQQKAVSQIFADLPNSINTPEINIPIAEPEKLPFIEKLRTQGNFEDAINILTIDGLRVEYPKGWGLVRASNTTANLVLRFEADSAEELQRIRGIFEREMGKVLI